MFNFTIRGHDLSDVKTISDLAEKTKHQGIHTLQLALGISFPELAAKEQLNPGMGLLIRDELAHNQISIGLLSCYINMIHPNLAVREELLQKFESYLAHASYFNASMVVSETGNVLPEIQYTEANFTEIAFEELLKVITRLLRAAEEHGVLLGIEPGLNHPLHSLDKVERLLNALPSDYLGIVFDPTNLITADNWQEQVAIVEAAYQKFGEKIVALHLKDFICQENQIIPVNIGEGYMNYSKILQIVEKYRPISLVVLEETKDDKIAAALKLLQA